MEELAATKEKTLRYELKEESTLDPTTTAEKAPREGNVSKCENYRGITPLLVPGNVFNRALLNWMGSIVGRQGGFDADMKARIDQGMKHNNN